MVKCVSSYLEVSEVVKYLTENFNHLDKDTITKIGLKSAGITSCEGYNCYLEDSLGVSSIPDFEDSEEITRESGSAVEILRSRGVIRGDDKLFTKEQKDFLDVYGYLIIPEVLSEDQVEKFSRLTLLIAGEEDKDGVSYRYGKSRKLQRIYNLISKHPHYVELIQHPLLEEILEYYFRKDTLHPKYVMSSFQSNIIYPGGEAQQVHVDGFGKRDNPLPSLATRLNLNFILTDWTKDNGATLLSPGSHKLLKTPDPSMPDNALMKVIAPKGSLVIWTGKTWHKSGENKSENPRFGLFSCFASSQIKELCGEEEHLAVVDKSVSDKLSPKFRFALGFDRGIKSGAYHRVDFTGTEFE